MRKLLNLI